MLRPALQDAIAHHCSKTIWKQLPVPHHVCPGVYQTVGEQVVTIVTAAQLPKAAVEAARQCRFLDSVALVMGQDREPLIEGPAGMMVPTEWDAVVTGLYEGLPSRGALMKVDLWLCDTNVEWACLLLGAPQVRVAFAELYGQDISEDQLRELLEQAGSPYPGLLEKLLDIEFETLMKDVA